MIEYFDSLEGYEIMLNKVTRIFVFVKITSITFIVIFIANLELKNCFRSLLEVKVLDHVIYEEDKSKLKYSFAKDFFESVYYKQTTVK
jgi:hypothetical protein